MLHDTRYKNIFAITYCINLDFLTHKILIYKDWMILLNSIDNSHEFNYIFIRNSNLHTLSTKYIWRTYKHWITKFVSSLKRLLYCEYSLSLSSWNLCLFKYFIKQLSILCSIYILCLSSKNRYSHLHKSFCKLNSCLSTKLHYCTIRLLKLNNTLNIFCCKRLKVKLISNIEVCWYCFRVIVDNDSFITLFLKWPCTMNWTEVKLNTLSDSYRTRTKYKHFLLIMSFCCFIFTAKYWIVVRSCCSKFCRTCINHLKCSMNIILIT